MAGALAKELGFPVRYQRVYVDDTWGRSGDVYYVKDGREIAYTIVGGEPLDVPPRGVDVDAAGTSVRLFDMQGRTVATWRKGGHTCVLAGDGAKGEQLAALAGSTSAY